MLCRSNQASVMAAREYVRTHFIKQYHLVPINIYELKNHQFFENHWPNTFPTYDEEQLFASIADDIAKEYNLKRRYLMEGFPTSQYIYEK